VVGWSGGLKGVGNGEESARGRWGGECGGRMAAAGVKERERRGGGGRGGSGWM